MFDAEAGATEDVEDAGSAALRCAGISSAGPSADGIAVPRARCPPDISSNSNWLFGCISLTV